MLLLTKSIHQHILVLFELCITGSAQLPLKISCQMILRVDRCHTQSHTLYSLISIKPMFSFLYFFIPKTLASLGDWTRVKIYARTSGYWSPCESAPFSLDSPLHRALFPAVQIARSRHLKTVNHLGLPLKSENPSFYMQVESNVSEIV